MNLEPKSSEQKVPLWFGSGFHFALEDFHGHNVFGKPEDALIAYHSVFRENELPIGADDAIELGLGMLGYYQQWVEHRNEYQTLVLEGVPQVEVGFDLELTELSGVAKQPVYYHGTFDRVVTDFYGRWWIEDYKTAAAIDTNKLQTDPQISAYLWAAEQWYQHPVEGMLYTQFAKDVPSEPKELAKGGFSQDKRQKTTHAVYRRALMHKFGKVPSEYVPFLNDLAAAETPEGNRFIRRDTVRRNYEEKVSTYKHIVAEGMEMLNDQLALYPNPTRDCMWDCNFRTCCIAVDGGSDFLTVLDQEFQVRNETAKGEKPEWRNKLDKIMQDKLTQRQ